MTTVCGSCGSSLPTEARFCSSCGASVEPAGARLEERKLVTILFADVSGSTALGERLDPERLRLIFGEYFAAMSAVIGGWSGTVEKYIGDAIMAVFGVPQVREDDAARALAASLEMLDRLDRLNDGFRDRHGIALAVRIGVNTGEVLAPVGEPVDQLIVTGDAVNTASRLQAAAEPGTVLVGERAWQAARDAFEFDEPRSLAVAGKAEPQVARRLLRRRPEPGRGIPGLHAPMVGRDRELATLVGLLDEALERGEARLCVVFGAAGIGKSRLVWELVQRAAARRPAPGTLRGRCIPAGHGITYWALAEILRAACDIGLDDPADIVRARLLGHVTELLGGADTPDTAETIGALAASAAISLGDDDPLSGFQPRAIDEAIGRAWPRFLTALAGRSPLVLVVEDLHWAVGQLVETLARIASRTRGPVLIIATARPEFTEKHPSFTTGMTGATAISLHPLTETQSDLVVGSLLDIADLPASQRSAIVERAEGNPFFIEEIVRRLIDQGVIVRSNGHWRATAAVESIVLPDSVHALLAARIDALPATERVVVREAAVIGKVFWAAPIRAAVPDLNVEGALSTLEDRGLVVARPTSTIAGETEYLFRHALVRDVAYEGLPRARRARAHAAVAEWTERLAGERTDEFAELLAHHYRMAAAGDDADLGWSDEPDRREALREQAVRWLVSAGKSARRRYALEQAVRLHEQALDLASRGAERRTVLEALGDDHAVAYHGDESVASYQAAIDEPGEGEDPAVRSRLFMKTAREASQKSGTFRMPVPPSTVEAWIDEGLAADPDDRTRAWLLGLRADVGTLWAGMVGSDPVSIDDRAGAARDSIELARRLDLPSLESATLGTLAQINERGNRFAESAASAEEMLTLAPRLDPSARLEAFIFAADAIALIGGDHVRAERLLLEAETLARGLSLHEQLHASGTLVELYFTAGRWDEASIALENHMRGFRAEPDVSCARVRGGPLVGALLSAHRGDIDRARQLLELAPPSTVRISAHSEGTRSRCLAAIGEPEAALAVIDPVLARSTLLYLSIAHLGRLEALEVAEDWPAVPAASETAEVKAGGDVVLRAVLDRVSATAAAGSGNVDAVARLTAAVERADRSGLPFEAARAREALAAHTPDAATSRDLFGAAVGTYEYLGAVPHAARVRERLATYETSAPSS